MLYSNKALSDRWGGDITGKRWIEFLSSKERRYAEDQIAQLTPGRPIIHLENAVHTPGGMTIWTHWINRGIWQDGELVRIEGVGVESEMPR